MPHHSAKSWSGRVWTLQDAPPDTPLPADLQPVAATCLRRRLHGNAPQDYLCPSIEHLHSPHDMAGMGRAVARIRAAIDASESVRIVTDYDVDGTTSSLILQTTLRLAGATGRVDYHIPDRFDEGYGFSVRAADRAADDGVSLILTADIGVRDHAAVSRAKSRGVDVIICDHHLPGGAAVPEDAYAVLCPPQPGCGYPNKALAACGVSLKLAQAMLEAHPKRDPILRSMLKLAAIGTVADVVDMGTRENRAIVTLGLHALSHTRHSPGLAALLRVSGVDTGHVVASDLGFRVGPRINAAGRLDNAMAVVELLLERDPAAADAQAQRLDQLNRDRQSIQERLVNTVIASLDDELPDFVVRWGPEADGWHRGVVGIVAAKVRDHVHRPVAIVSVAGDQATGSVRSTTSVHAVAALDQASDLLDRYGGHPAAAGFSLPADRLPALAARLATAASAGDQFAPKLDLEARCAASELGPLLARQLEQLGPHGKGNPEPLLLIDAGRVRDLRPFGKGHLRFRVGDIEAMWWRGADRIDALRAGPVQLAGRLGFNRWKGRETVRLTVEDARDA